jgi:hypothetical protein
MEETLLEKKDLFAKIRITSASRKRKESRSLGQCESAGCHQEATHKARKTGGGYWNFCLQHVTAWNKSYNYFAPESSGETSEAAGLETPGPATMRLNSAHRVNLGRTPDDCITFVPEGQPNRRASYRKAGPSLCATAMKALDTLGIAYSEANATTIKSRYKRLVKNFHPDMNDGDRSFEDRLNEIIRAYNTLQALGQC